MRASTGVSIKVLEAWAAGVAVVVSPWAALGTSGGPGEDFLVAESAEEWSAPVSALLADPVARSRLARAGRARLAADYAPESVGESLLGLSRPKVTSQRNRI